MELLEKRILKDGTVLPGNILKVGSFLNHQLDVDLLDAMGAEFARLYQNQKITKILTIEASGIAIACFAARYFKLDNNCSVPVVFAKKNKTNNVNSDVYSTQIQSFTHGKTYDVIISKQFLNAKDRVLIIDDFLANGCALQGLIKLVQDAGATVVGAGIAIEKGFQNGGQLIRSQGTRLESLAIIESMTENSISFRH